MIASWPYTVVGKAGETRTKVLGWSGKTREVTTPSVCVERETHFYVAVASIGLKAGLWLGGFRPRLVNRVSRWEEEQDTEGESEDK